MHFTFKKSVKDFQKERIFTDFGGFSCDKRILASGV